MRLLISAAPVRRSGWIPLAILLIPMCACAMGADDLVAPGAEPRMLADGFKFTEGPAANDAGDIFFSDIPNQKILKWSVAENALSVFTGNSGGANGLYFSKDGSLYACAGEDRKLVSFSPVAGVTTLAEEYGGRPFNRPNDLWIDPRGGVYFSDPNYGEREKAQDGEHVYYLEPDRERVVRVISDMTRPNGLIGTADGRKLYVADAGANKTYVYDIREDGTLANGELFVESGSDGMSLDERGNLYLTAGGVQIYSPEGKLLEAIEFPAAPSNLTFGGPERRTLFVTARHGFYALEMAVKGHEAR